MKPHAPTPRRRAARFAAAIAASLAAVALALGGCGSSSATSAQKTASAPARTGAKPAAVASCRSQLGGFVGSLDTLRRDLAVGLAYETYVEQVEIAKSAYGRLPVDSLTLDCLDSAGTAAERALNQYLRAANEWGECLSEASCETVAIEPKLQRRWRIASHFLSEARLGAEPPRTGRSADPGRGPG